MDHTNSLDEVDKIILDCFENEEEVNIPEYVQNSIDQAISKTEKKNYNIYFIKRVAIIICILFLITSTVFAKEIIKFVSSLFTNSTNSIDVAVENNYVQKINTNYIYNDNIGIMIDYILMDDTKLDLSLMYKNIGNKSISSIKINDFTIKNEKDSIIWVNKIGIKNNIQQGNRVILHNDSIKIDDNTYKDSILVLSEHFENCNKIIINIESILIETNNEIETLYGNWNFEIPIKKEILKREEYEYNVLADDYLENGSAKLNETTFKIILTFNKKIDFNTLNNDNGIVLEDSKGNEYNDRLYHIRIDKDNKELYLEYNISKYEDNIDNFILYLQISENTNIDIYLKK